MHENAFLLWIFRESAGLFIIDGKRCEGESAGRDESIFRETSQFLLVKEKSYFKVNKNNKKNNIIMILLQ